MDPSAAGMAGAAACFALCVVSGIFPFVNAEVVLIGFVAAAGSRGVLALVLAATVGQMIGKSVMYWVGRGAHRVPGRRHRETLARWARRFERAPKTIVFFVLLSAFTGIPRFYVVSVLAGTFRVNFAAFVAAGTIGRFCRFSLLALFPHAVTQLVRG